MAVQNRYEETSESEYLRLNSKYLKGAEKLLAKKDYPQASEKLWGAFVEAVKVLAIKQGISLETYGSIAEFISRLHRKHPEWNLTNAFKHAESLHVNFYENHLPEDHIMESKKVLEESIRLMLESE